MLKKKKENDDEYDLFGDEYNSQNENDTKKQDDLENSDNENIKKNSKIYNVRLTKRSLTSKFNQDTYITKIPIFFKVNPYPFEPDNFKKEFNQFITKNKNILTSKELRDKLTIETLSNENSIRWRYFTNENNEYIKQSNTHFIKWSDSSISLKIGNELFDFKEIPTNDLYLVRDHSKSDVFQTDSIINKSVILVPTSTHASTHKKLTEVIKNVQKKEKILNTLTLDDPLMEQKIADENEKKIHKLKKQLDYKRNLQNLSHENKFNFDYFKNNDNHKQLNKFKKNEYDSADENYVSNKNQDLLEKDIIFGANKLNDLKKEELSLKKNDSPINELKKIERKRRKIDIDDDD